MSDVSERVGAVTFKGNPVTLLGPEVKVGDPAPDFRVLSQSLSPVSLADTPGKPRLFSVVPSLDTPVCSEQTRKFESALAELGDRVALYTISLDLPFAQKRFCSDAAITHMQTLSDVHDHSFGKAYGVLIKGLPLPLLARAVFVLDAQGVVRHVEYVAEVTSHPDYDKTIAALKQLVA